MVLSQKRKHINPRELTWYLTGWIYTVSYIVNYFMFYVFFDRCPMEYIDMLDLFQLDYLEGCGIKIDFYIVLQSNKKPTLFR